MADDPRAPLPPVLRELRSELHSAWREQEGRSRDRARRRIGAAVILAIAVGVPTAIAAPSLFTSAPAPTPHSAPSAAYAAEGTAALGNWRFALLRRRGTLCVVLRAVAKTPVLADACDPAFPRHRPLTVAIATTGDGTWIYGLSTAPIHSVTVRTGSRQQTVRTMMLRPQALRFARADDGLRGFLVALPGAQVRQPSVIGRADDARAIFTLSPSTSEVP